MLYQNALDSSGFIQSKFCYQTRMPNSVVKGGKEW